MKKTVFFGLTLFALGLHAMERDIRDVQDSATEKNNYNKGEDYLSTLSDEVVVHIIKYLTGLRKAPSGMTRGLEEAKKDMENLYRTCKRFRDLLDISNKKSWFHKQIVCKQCKENAYTTPYHNGLWIHEFNHHQWEGLVLDYNQTEMLSNIM
jgi:hypothetical protein